MPHVRFQVPFLGPESQLKSGFACAGLLCSPARNKQKQTLCILFQHKVERIHLVVVKWQFVRTVFPLSRSLRLPQTREPANVQRQNAAAETCPLALCCTKGDNTVGH